MINSRLISDLDPDAAFVCNAHVLACHRIGIELLITSTWRDHIAQDALYAIGRTVELKRKPVTNAQGWHSWHNYRCAWDVVPLVRGKAVWESPLWREVIAAGKEAGAEAGADWVNFPDRPHFQLRPMVHTLHISLDEAKNRFTQHGTIFTA